MPLQLVEGLIDIPNYGGKVYTARYALLLIINCTRYGHN